MNCSRARKNISDYIDGSLPHRSRCEYEAHISRCRECANELDATRKMLSSLSSLAVRGSSVDLWPRLSQAILEPVSPGPFWRLLVRPVVAAPAAALAAALAVMLFLPTQRMTPPSDVSVAIPEYAHYIAAHARSQRQQVFADPDVSFVAAELERARLIDAARR
ncbi:MAG: anti-sigma factor family protein [Armatimonadota bacterium]